MFQFINRNKKYSLNIEAKKVASIFYLQNSLVITSLIKIINIFLL
ncbi:hypothetical protein FDC06_19410 [Clostridium botulinum]|nr:hypothetical protein CLB_3141 [Clostridium botulinum A str. ATCC 19397]ABS39059.1 hypothetical protein CLC_3014 [Clostridium botulinum A str. Hall]AWB18925.1 hypothetical protein DB732_15925 [Clostridium botulinum]AWB31738.1 hypothetical protein DBN47_16220 [Clostridium botulinum]EGT5617457.1 hypothetical protein [Clostridium botulinum]